MVCVYTRERRVCAWILKYGVENEMEIMQMVYHNRHSVHSRILASDTCDVRCVMRDSAHMIAD